MKEPELSNVNVTAFSSSAGQLVQGTSAVPVLSEIEPQAKIEGQYRWIEDLARAVPLHMLPAAGAIAVRQLMRENPLVKTSGICDNDSGAAPYKALCHEQIEFTENKGEPSNASI